jgi:hypothetical protein
MKSLKPAHRRPKSSLEFRSTYFRSEGTVEKSLLSTVRERKNKSRRVPPEEAAEVVKNYIVPLFEKKTWTRPDRRRHKSSTVINLSTSKGPVAEELVLSGQLLEKLKESQEAESKTTQKYQDLQQVQINCVESNKGLEILVIEQESTIRMLNHQILMMEKEMLVMKGENQFNFHQFLQYKEFNQKMVCENKELASMLYNERAKTDIRLSFLFFLTMHIRLSTAHQNWSTRMQFLSFKTL